MNKILAEIVLTQTKSKKILNIQEIQSLWSGYGSLCRIQLDTESVILKHINLSKMDNHPKGWEGNLSHKRKTRSYLVERNWYQKYNDFNLNMRTPKLIHCGEINKNESYLLLEDLNNSGFKTRENINFDEIKLCLKWLAKLHQENFQKKPLGLWDIGTYWHLKTREEELNAMDDLELKEAAPRIDTILNGAKYQTFVHGDAKLANFLFQENNCAAVDFQYVGKGIGIKDVAYFLSSIFSSHELEKHEESCLNYYFSELNLSKDVESEWRELYPYVWCDFYRFLNGWSPSHYKINSYSLNMRNKVLKCI